jgi:hypothetical protein
MYDFKKELKEMDGFLSLEDQYEQEKLKGNKQKAEKIRKLLIKKEASNPLIQVGHMILSSIDERRQRDKKS